jgi:hypothetical protein
MTHLSLELNSAEQNSLDAITKWLRQSGLVIIQDKNEMSNENVVIQIHLYLDISSKPGLNIIFLIAASNSKKGFYIHSSIHHPPIQEFTF